MQKKQPFNTKKTASPFDEYVHVDIVRGSGYSINTLGCHECRVSIKVKGVETEAFDFHIAREVYTNHWLGRVADTLAYNQDFRAYVKDYRSRAKFVIPKPTERQQARFNERLQKNITEANERTAKKHGVPKENLWLLQSGQDQYSPLRNEALASLVDTSVVEDERVKELPELAQNSVYRWILRGLALVPALHKVMQTQQTAKKYAVSRSKFCS
jgi:hypothetical protein